MAFNLFDAKGCPIDQQGFTWAELAGKPISKLDDDAFSRVRVILMHGIEKQALRFQHMMSCRLGELRGDLARIRRVEHQQAAAVGAMLGADHSLLELTIAYEQTAIEVTAALAQREPDTYIAQALRFGMLEDFDHLYRFSALLDRLEGKDANTILQSYTDILPGRPTAVQHRAPEDDVRAHYSHLDARPATRLHALTILAAESQVHDFYLTVGPMFADPVARQLYAEIGTIEEQHVTHYGSLIDPEETWLEKWLLHEATEVYQYYACLQQEHHPGLKAMWERCLDYELGHFHHVAALLERHERRDPRAILPGALPDPVPFASQRDFVRRVLLDESSLSACGTQFVPAVEESPATRAYRARCHLEGTPSDIAAAGYVWTPGTELNRKLAVAA